MTAVVFALLTPTGRSVNGPLTITATTRARTPAGVVVPLPLVLGSAYTPLGPMSVDLLPTPGMDAPAPWCYRVDEPGGVTRHIAVPPTGPVAYADLPDVDPTTLAPAPAAPERAWALALQELAARVVALEAGAPPPAPGGYVATFLEDTL